MSSASITSDAELMWNLLPAVTIPSQSKFLTAYDRNGNPMVFGIGTDEILRVAQEHPDTRLRQLVDLHPILDLPQGALVKGFDLWQSESHDIYLGLAYSTGTETRLMAVRPFSTDNVDFTIDTTRLSVFKTTRLDAMKPHDVTLGTFIEEDFPAIILTYTNTSNNSRNVKHYDIENDAVRNQGDLSLPVNSSDIIGIVPGKVGRHTGVFVLYKQQDTKQLMFTSWSTQFDNLLHCPPNAGYVATIANTKGGTDLIVGGDGIYHFAMKDMLAAKAQSSSICDSAEFNGISDMHIARHGNDASIWATTGESGVSYLELDASKLDGVKHPAKQEGVPLLPAGSAGGIAGFTGSDGRNAILVSDLSNKMSYLEQAPDTKMWKTTPFWFPSTTNTTQIHSYMTRIVAHDQANAIMPGCFMTIAASGFVDVVINGVPTKLSKTPTTVQSDNEGAINIINPTTDISSYGFQVQAVYSDNKQELNLLTKPVTINPMAKVEKSLSNMSSEKLESATTAEGEKVFQNTTPDLLKQACDVLNQIVSVRDDVKDEWSTFTDSTSVKSISKSVNSLVSDPVGTIADAVMHPVDTVLGIGSKIKDVFWDFWNFVKASYNKVKNWAIQTYNKVKALVIDFGDKAYRFVLETATQIAKAADFVYTKYLKAPFEAVVSWIQNIFSWKDVVETKNHIADFINATLDYGSTNLSWAADKVDAKFLGWQTLLKEQLSPKNIPDRVKDKKASPQSQDNVDKATKEKNDKAAVKQNWTKYQLTHGGALGGAVIESAAEDSVKQYQETWDTVIKPIFDSLSETAGDILHDITLLFKDNEGITPGDILQKLGIDVVVGILDAVRALLVGLLKRLSLVVSDFKALVNKKIKVPIFSDLWVFANKIFGKDVEAPTFTVLGFVSFVLAIPITWTCKLFTGKKPLAPPKFNVKTLENVFDESASSADQTAYNAFAGMLEIGAAGMLGIFGLAGTIGGVSGALAGIFDFQLLFGLVRVAVCVPTKKDLPLWEVRCAISAVDVVNVFILAVARKVDKGGKGEKVVAVIEGCTAAVNIALATAVNVAELADEKWAGYDEERTSYQILISVLGGVSTIGKVVATISDEPYTKLGGVVAKQVAGKASGFFSIANTYGNIGKGKYTYILNSGS